jgi:D-alanyl-lipoteichoic acid acyltransferase DltB (MBOAT superfamily)
MWFYWLSLVMNLSLLLLLKYVTFFQMLLHDLAIPISLIPLTLSISTIGLSYYVFKAISYVTDIYQEVYEGPVPSLIEHWAYLFFFPVILAGPILRPHELLPQFRQASLPISYEKGSWFILQGLFKKLILADLLAVGYINRVFESPARFSETENLFAILSYPLQLYFDFCGYTDVCVGISLLLGFQIPHNFNEPFRARSLTEFWRRWHITLSQWLRDYLFLPLSYVFRWAGKLGMAMAIFLTFLLSGLWHGAAYTFLFWGMAHGTWLALEMLLRPITQHIWKPVQSVLGFLITFSFLLCTFALFRSPDWSTFTVLIQKGLSTHAFSLLPEWFQAYPSIALLLIAGYLFLFLPTSWKQQIGHLYETLPFPWQVVLILTSLLLIYNLRSEISVPVIYLQF